MNAPSLSQSERRARVLSYLVPAAIRQQFLGDLRWDRREMRERGVPGLSITLFSIQEMLNGISQHLPLRPTVREEEAPEIKSRVAERAARTGWLAWRASGMLLLGGYLGASGLIFTLGALALAAALVALVVVAVASEEPLSVRQTLFVNGLLGGVFISLFLIVACGAFTSVLIAIGWGMGWGALSGFAMNLLVAFSLLTVCVLTASGWVAEEWFPKRLIRNESGRVI